MNGELLPILKDLSVIKRLPLLGGSLTKIFTFRTKHFVHYLRCPQSASLTVLLTSDSFFFKTKFVTGYYQIDTIAKQSSLPYFCMVGNNPSNSSVSFETVFFFRDCRSIQFFKLLCWQRKSLICREKSLWELRWPITVTTKTKWNTVKKEILINQKFCSQIKRVCFQFEKVYLQRKNIKSQRKKICLHTQNKPTANSCGKFPRQIATAYFQGK